MDAERDLRGRRWRRVARKTIVELDLKSQAGRDAALGAQADALIEGLRPGVMERLGQGLTIAHAAIRRSCTGG